jgi:hypothetical protein
MDLEEQRLRHQIEARQTALREKIIVLKERIERLKRMGDVKSKVEQRPGLMFMGSVLAGFIIKRLVSGKKRHPVYTYPTDSPKALSPTSLSAAGQLWDPVSAIISALATRTVLRIISEMKKLIPRRHEARRSERNAGNNGS